MIIDFTTLTDEALSGRFDLCVCGTGPAGMTIARKVASRGGRVLLLEAGGLNRTAESQDVYNGRSAGSIDYVRIQTCRLRYFGGTSGHWSGRCSLFDPIDFEDRDIFELPGWPISYDEAYEYLPEACEILDIREEDLRAPSFPLWNSDRYRVGGFTFSPPTRFGTKYRKEIEDSASILAVLNANVVDLVVAESGDRINAVVVKGYDGSSRTITAERFVIAFGAMENARFLLAARSQIPDGIGNATGMVGRTFMEHFDVELGKFVRTNEDFWKEFTMPSGQGRPLLPTEKMLREDGIGNSTVATKPFADPNFYGRLAPLRKARRDVICSIEPLRLQMQGSDSSLVCPGEGFTGTITEQMPNLDSRIVLDDSATDAFGMPRLVLYYELLPQDRKTIRSLAMELGKALAAQDVARMQVFETVLDGTSPVGSHCHHMGTTRMADDPQYGVVDRDCRVFGFDNLYIGGASVFSTGGGVNPTLTLVSLAVRLGNHIADQVDRS